MKVPANVRRCPDFYNTFKNNCFTILKNKASVRLLLLLLLLCRSMKLWNAVHIMSSIGRIA